jgi:hypothetical protein
MDRDQCNSELFLLIGGSNFEEPVNQGQVLISNWRSDEQSTDESSNAGLWQEFIAKDDNNVSANDDNNGGAAELGVIPAVDTQDDNFVQHIVFNESTVQQYNPDYRGGAFEGNDDNMHDINAEKSEAVHFLDFVKSMGAAKVQSLVKTVGFKPIRKKYIIADPVKRMLVKETNRVNAQKLRDLKVAQDIALNREVDLLRVAATNLREFKKQALAFLRDKNKEADLLAFLQALHVADPM